VRAAFVKVRFHHGDHLPACWAQDLKQPVGVLTGTYDAGLRSHSAPAVVVRQLYRCRCKRRVVQLATVRVETPPGDQKHVLILRGAWVRIFVLVAVLSYSRRRFVRAFLNERQDGFCAMYTSYFSAVDHQYRCLTPVRP
jgi:hypothetical protein